MKVLLSLNSFGLLRNFEFAVRLFAQRGHTIHIVSDREDNLGGIRLAEDLAKEYPGISFDWAPRPRRKSGWYSLALGLRVWIDYLHYLHPRYVDAPKLRARGEAQVPASVIRFSRFIAKMGPWAIGFLSRGLRALERSVPNRREVERLIAEQKPDLLLVSPLLYLGSNQVDYVRVAKAQGIKTVLCVGSWDHLTSKGLIHEIPDRVLVWNEMQKQEAVELHGVPADRVIVTGAQTYDHWFAWKLSRSREEFFRLVGLAPEQPFLLYVCSSRFIAPNEAGFVGRWIQQIRASDDDQLNRVGILIRPHPQNAEQWERFDLAEFKNVALFPRGGANPIDVQARNDYYDSIYHSAAVVGVNTSALIESGIIGRSVYTLLDPEFAGTQEGTLHFRHLLNVNGGLLNVAESFDQHLTQLSAALCADGRTAEKNRKFIGGFIRPQGLDVPAAPLFVEALERLAESPDRRPMRTPLWVYPLRLLLYPLAASVEDSHEKQLKNRKKKNNADSTRREA